MQNIGKNVLILLMFANLYRTFNQYLLIYMENFYQCFPKIYFGKL
jgi:hypothetical protein